MKKINAVKLFRETDLSVREISLKLNLSVALVNKELLDWRYSNKGSGSFDHRYGILMSMRDDIVKDYRNGRNLKRLRKIYGIDVKVIQEIIDRHGQRKFNERKVPTVKEIDQMIYLRGFRLTYKEIGEMIGFKTNTVMYYIKKTQV